MYILISIPNSGVGTAILNPVDIFRMWRKLNFGPLRGQVGWKQRGKSFWAVVWIFYYLFKETGLDTRLGNSCWI